MAILFVIVNYKWFFSRFHPLPCRKGLPTHRVKGLFFFKKKVVSEPRRGRSEGDKYKTASKRRGLPEAQGQLIKAFKSNAQLSLTAIEKDLDLNRNCYILAKNIPISRLR
ncbi:MAG: hypothetical protein QW429_03455 [Thermoprotei archaeon]